MQTYAEHYEKSTLVASAPAALFAYLDDPSTLSGHMAKSSWRMGGGKMTIEVDAGQWKRVGSTARLAGKAFGMPLSVQTRLTDYHPPQRKVWETIGEPRLLVIGPYRMGIDLSPKREITRLNIFIDYDLPKERPYSWFGGVLGRAYARWCVISMLEDTVSQFDRSRR